MDELSRPGNGDAVISGNAAMPWAVGQYSAESEQVRWIKEGLYSGADAAEIALTEVSSQLWFWDLNGDFQPTTAEQADRQAADQ